MNTIQINGCMANSKTFLGTFSADKLPLRTTHALPFSFIANTDPSHQPGTHWVGFFVTEEEVEVFDSYGREMCPLFKRFIGSEKHICNEKQVQQFGSSVCGQYCIYYIYQRERGQSMTQILSKFKHPDQNDAYVRDWVHDRFSCRPAGPSTTCIQGCKCFTH